MKPTQRFPALSILARVALLSLVVLACRTSAQSLDARQAEAQRIADDIRQALETGRFDKAGLGRHLTDILETFYAERGYKPAWLGAKGLSPAARALVAELARAEQHGLTAPRQYTPEIENLLASKKKLAREKQSLAEIDLRLTELFLIYGSHLAQGRAGPDAADQPWHADLREVDLAGALARTAESGETEKELAKLAPSHDEYRRLQQAHELYLGIQRDGGWARVLEGPSLKPGDRSARVPSLRERLTRSGELEPRQDVPDVDLYDPSLVTAVTRFQERHGLEPDGVLGKATLEALNVPVEARLVQLRVNMERWRWIPENLGDRYVVANIPGFELDVIEHGEPVLRMRIITGKTYDPTPILSDEISYLVLNPTWTVPESIAREEILPTIQKDPGYLSRQGMRVFDGPTDEAKEVAPSGVDWNSITPDKLTYTFRQDPGALNPLGRIKFMFPNRFNVYLHDTPNDHLFDGSVRSLSHGCVRLENPLELAELLLQGDPTWTREALLAAIATGETKNIKLPRQTPVHLLYWTAWVGNDGSLQFRKDIYGLDARMAQTLPEVVEGPATSAAARLVNSPTVSGG